MEAHPIPQNISEFEFHLIGDMTLKQFAYLAAGLAITYLTFIFIGISLPLIAWPIMLTSALIGTAFAFLPVMERPLDYWVAAFLRAIFRPTQRTFKAVYIDPTSPLFKNRLEIYLAKAQGHPWPLKTPEISLLLNSSPQAASPVPAASPVLPTDNELPRSRADEVSLRASSSVTDSSVETSTVFSIKNKIAPPVSQNRAAEAPQPVTPSSLPSAEELKKEVELAKEAQEIQTKILATEKQLNQIKASAAEPGADPRSFTEQFQRVLSELQELNKKAGEISKKQAASAKNPSLASARSAAITQPKNITTLSLTSIPNIINGIVTDALGNYVEGAIIVAHDSQDLPVRALKTNKLGQFIAATPLTNGTYTISTERDDLLFDKVRIVLQDRILQPILIPAKRAERILQ